MILVASCALSAAIIAACAVIIIRGHALPAEAHESAIERTVT
jgi:hypothetical protein